MIFFSTGGVRDKPAFQTAEELNSQGVHNIELSGGKFLENQLDKLKLLKSDCNFLVHNYFPPPKESFVFNLASLNNDISVKSIEHAKLAIDYAVNLNSPTYTFHAGFLIDPEVKELGNKIKPKKLFDKKDGLSTFISNLNYLSSYAETKNVELLVENNVLSKNNKELFKSNPLLMTDITDCIEIMSSTPDNVNLLVDVAHLKVSSNSQSFSCKDYLKKADKWIKGYHLSDNNGLSDTNNKVTNDSWFWNELNKDIEFITIEVYGLNVIETKDQIDLVQSKICQK